MTAKPSPVSLTPGQQPRSPTPGIYTAAAPRWDAGQGAWLGYLGGDPPPTPKRERKGLALGPTHRPRSPARRAPCLPLRLPALPAASLPAPASVSSPSPPLPSRPPSFLLSSFSCPSFSPLLLLLSLLSPFGPSLLLLHTRPLPTTPLLPSFSIFCLHGGLLSLTLNSSLVPPLGSRLSLSFQGFLPTFVSARLTP